MNLVESFCTEIGLNIRLDVQDIRHIVDMSNFDCVDGEEGDNGVIKYNTLDGELIAIRTIYGGDEEEIEFTEIGKELLKPFATYLLENNIKNL